MADFSTTAPVPSLTSTYTDVLSIINSKFTDVIRGLDTSTAGGASPTNLPSGSIRWDNTNQTWQRYDGTNWVSLATNNTFGINISGNAATATAATSAGSVTNGVYLTTAQTLTNKTITGLRETRIDLGSGSNIDINLGNYFTKTATANLTLTFTNVPASGTVGSVILELTNGGAYTFTLTGVKWAGAQTPALTASGKDILAFYTHDGGTTWNGLLLAKDVR